MAISEGGMSALLNEAATGSVEKALAFVGGSMNPSRNGNAIISPTVIVPANLRGLATTTKSFTIYGNFQAQPNVTTMLVWLVNDGCLNLQLYRQFPAGSTLPSPGQTTSVSPNQPTCGLAYLQMVFLKTAFIPCVDAENVQVEPKIAAHFTIGRTVSGVVRLKSDSTSTTSAAMSGTFSAGSLGDTRDAGDFSAPRLAQQSVVKKNGITDEKVQRGITTIVGPDILPDFPPVNSDLVKGMGNAGYLSNVLPSGITLQGWASTPTQPYGVGSQPSACWISPYTGLVPDNTRPPVLAVQEDGTVAAAPSVSAQSSAPVTPPLQIIPSTNPFIAPIALGDTLVLKMEASVNVLVENDISTGDPVAGLQLSSTVFVLHYFASTYTGANGPAVRLQCVPTRHELQDNVSPQWFAGLGKDQACSTTKPQTWYVCSAAASPEGLIPSANQPGLYYGTNQAGLAPGATITMYDYLLGYYRIPQVIESAPERPPNTLWVGSFVATTNNGAQNRSTTTGNYIGSNIFYDPSNAGYFSAGVVNATGSESALPLTVNTGMLGSAANLDGKTSGSVYGFATTVASGGGNYNNTTAVYTGNQWTAYTSVGPTQAVAADPKQPMVVYSTIWRISVYAPKMYNQGALGPARCILWQNVAQGQNMLVSGEVIVEAVPTGQIAPFYNNSQVAATSVNPGLVDLLKFLCNGNSEAFKVMFKGDDYDIFCSTFYSVLCLGSPKTIRERLSSLAEKAPEIITPKALAASDSWGTDIIKKIIQQLMPRSLVKRVREILPEEEEAVVGASDGSFPMIRGPKQVQYQPWTGEMDRQRQLVDRGSFPFDDYQVSMSQTNPMTGENVPLPGSAMGQMGASAGQMGACGFFDSLGDMFSGAVNAGKQALSYAPQAMQLASKLAPLAGLADAPMMGGCSFFDDLGGVLATAAPYLALLDGPYGGAIGNFGAQRLAPELRGSAISSNCTLSVLRGGAWKNAEATLGANASMPPGFLISLSSFLQNLYAPFVDNGTVTKAAWRGLLLTYSELMKKSSNGLTAASQPELVEQFLASSLGQMGTVEQFLEQQVAAVNSGVKSLPSEWTGALATFAPCSLCKLFQTSKGLASLYVLVPQGIKKERVRFYNPKQKSWQNVTSTFVVAPTLTGENPGKWLEEVVAYSTDLRSVRAQLLAYNKTLPPYSELKCSARFLWRMGVEQKIIESNGWKAKVSTAFAQKWAKISASANFSRLQSIIPDMVKIAKIRDDPLYFSQLRRKAAAPEKLPEQFVDCRPAMRAAKWKGQLNISHLPTATISTTPPPPEAMRATIPTEIAAEPLTQAEPQGDDEDDATDNQATHKRRTDQGQGVTGIESQIPADITSDF